MTRKLSNENSKDKKIEDYTKTELKKVVDEESNEITSKINIQNSKFKVPDVNKKYTSNENVGIYTFSSSVSPNPNSQKNVYSEQNNFDISGNNYNNHLSENDIYVNINKIKKNNNKEYNYNEGLNPQNVNIKEIKELNNYSPKSISQRSVGGGGAVTGKIQLKEKEKEREREREKSKSQNDNQYTSIGGNRQGQNQDIKNENTDRLGFGLGVELEDKDNEPKYSEYADFEKQNLTKQNNKSNDSVHLTTAIKNEKNETEKVKHFYDEHIKDNYSDISSKHEDIYKFKQQQGYNGYSNSNFQNKSGNFLNTDLNRTTGGDNHQEVINNEIMKIPSNDNHLENISSKDSPKYKAKTFTSKTPNHSYSNYILKEKNNEREHENAFNYTRPYPESDVNSIRTSSNVFSGNSKALENFSNREVNNNPWNVNSNSTNNNNNKNEDYNKDYKDYKNSYSLNEKFNQNSHQSSSEQQRSQADFSGVGGQSNPIYSSYKSKFLNNNISNNNNQTENDQNNVVNNVNNTFSDGSNFKSLYSYSDNTKFLAEQSKDSRSYISSNPLSNQNNNNKSFDGKSGIPKNYSMQEISKQPQKYSSISDLNEEKNHSSKGGKESSDFGGIETNNSSKYDKLFEKFNTERLTNEKKLGGNPTSASGSNSYLNSQEEKTYQNYTNQQFKPNQNHFSNLGSGGQSTVIPSAIEIGGGGGRGHSQLYSQKDIDKHSEKDGEFDQKGYDSKQKFQPKSEYNFKKYSGVSGLVGNPPLNSNQPSSTNSSSTKIFKENNNIEVKSGFTNSNLSLQNKLIYDKSVNSVTAGSGVYSGLSNNNLNNIESSHAYQYDNSKLDLNAINQGNLKGNNSSGIQNLNAPNFSDYGIKDYDIKSKLSSIRNQMNLEVNKKLTLEGNKK